MYVCRLSWRGYEVINFYRCYFMYQYCNSCAVCMCDVERLGGRKVPLQRDSLPKSAHSHRKCMIIANKCNK